VKFDTYFRAQYKVNGTHVTPLPMEDENFFLSAAQNEVENVGKTIQPRYSISAHFQWKPLAQVIDLIDV